MGYQRHFNIPLFRRRRVGGASQLINWFLATGVWNPGGIWVDAVPYPTPPFFLASGAWNPFGFWIDDEVWP